MREVTQRVQILFWSLSLLFSFQSHQYLVSPIFYQSHICSSSIISSVWLFERPTSSYSIFIKNFIIPIRHFIQFPQKFIRHNLYPQKRTLIDLMWSHFTIPTPVIIFRHVMPNTPVEFKTVMTIITSHLIFHIVILLTLIIIT